MSVRKTSRPARFWPPLTMPNSAACLIELVVSPPALASPMILAFDACACSRNEREVLRVERCADLAQHLAAVLQHDGFGVALQRQPERVVGGQEEPGVAARLDDRAAGAVGEHPGVVGPVHGIGRACLAGQIRRGRTGGQEHLALVAGDLVDRERDAGIGNVDDDVDLVDVVPLARDAGADVGLVLMVGGDDLDLVAALFDARILDGHPRRRDRARAGQVGVQARHVGQDADLDHVVGNLRLRGAGGERAGHRQGKQTAFECVHQTFPL